MRMLYTKEFDSFTKSLCETESAFEKLLKTEKLVSIYLKNLKNEVKMRMSLLIMKDISALEKRLLTLNYSTKLT